jgi:hypothetical protein
VALCVRAQDSLGAMLDVVGECFDPRSIGDSELLIAAPIEHDRAL